ncbi:Nucleolar protein 6 [Pseudolycoriella hygida]|uniref:Nucleolar protein 6 n=1 Tax=Pseudolycoriella hygida TaxID=35572 RepID=A0A9Q0MMZ2_9DIPT|nr:Nucleolar protein 6 [Pseudolycoriella hygida]
MLNPNRSDKPSNKRKKEVTQNAEKKLKSNNYKAATQEELNQLQESCVDLSETVLSLQIENILKSFKISAKYEHFIETWLAGLTEFFGSLPSESEKKQSSEIKWLNKKVINPMNNEQFNLPKFVFQFLTPKSIRLTGSKLLSTLQSDNISVDVAVEMPKKCFQKEDYLNTIYHQKKAIYLCYLASKLRKWDQQTNLEFTYDRLDALRPILRITATSDLKKTITCNVHVQAEEGSFKLSRFVPWNSNVRDALFDASDSESGDIVPTPHHNMSIMRDLTSLANDNFLVETVKPVVNVTKGISLFKLWLKARCLNEDFCGFNGHIVSMFAAYLIKTKKLNSSMSVFDVIRSIFLNLKFSKWHVKGIAIVETMIPIEKSNEIFDVVFYDSTGWYNVCGSLSLDIYLRTIEESSRALAFLDSKNVNNFRYLFLQDMNPLFQFDHLFHITETAKLDKILSEHGCKSDRDNYVGQWYPHILKLFTSILRRGLTGRIHSLTPLPTKGSSWQVTESPPNTVKTLSFGIKLNMDNCLDVLTKGPQANHVDAESFKLFWGSKSDLRRFQDGNITESCVWASPSDNLMKKRLITRDICLFLMNHHYNIKAPHINYVAGQFDLAYRVSRTFANSDSEYENSENLALAVIRSFDDLAKMLRSLDVELEVTSVLGSSPVFRYCEINPVLPNATLLEKENLKIFQSYRTNDGVIELASSGKWPDDVVAINHVKAAFCLKIAQQLNEKCQLKSRGNVDTVEVLKDGFLFRFKLLVKKELALMKEMPQRKMDSFLMEKDFILPKLNTALHTLYLKNPCYGPAVLIAKRWLYSQLIDPFLWPDICTELLMAYVFIENKSYDQPLQPQFAFIRFLELLRTTDWRSHLVILDFSEELKDTQISEMENNFKSDRNSYPPLSIITSYDTKKNSMWSKLAPTVEVLTRVTILSNHTIQLFEENMLSDVFRTKMFFKASYEGYDVLLALRKNHLRTTHIYDFFMNTKKHNLVDKTVPAAGFNPVDYFLRELRAAYSDLAIFFYNPCGGDTIAVLWKPNVLEVSDFDPNNMNGRRYRGHQKYEYNLPQIIEDFQIIGRGLVENVIQNK